ncbi:hypothetical protein [Fibrobacter sp.]|uniref:hypothetical protein n=1 Tax=Fibrobacter sp. TaxID=35828 RepID=UPI00386A5F44
MEKVFTKRVYNKWTPEEDDMIRRGEIPPNHPSYANCLTRARKLGFKFVKKRQEGGRWSELQDNMVRKGVVPPEKGLERAIQRGNELGVDFLKLFYEKMDTNGLQGLTKDERMLIMAANENSLKEFKVKDSASIHRAAQRGKKFFLMHAKSLLSIQDIANKENCSRQNVHRLIDAYKIQYFNEHCFDQAVKEAEDEGIL